MAEATAQPSSDNTPQGVALKLLYTIAFAEEKALWSGAPATEKPTRQWVLETYTECLRVVQGHR